MIEVYISQLFISFSSVTITCKKFALLGLANQKLAISYFLIEGFPKI